MGTGPIKHARRPKSVHRRYERFFAFGDAAAYHTRLRGTREALAGRVARERRVTPASEGRSTEVAAEHPGE
jgi:hypothetical protein